MPDRLPPHIFILGLLKQLWRFFSWLARLAFVSTIWGLIPLSCMTQVKLYLNISFFSSLLENEPNAASSLFYWFLFFLDGIAVTLGLSAFLVGIILFRDYYVSRAVTTAPDTSDRLLPTETPPTDALSPGDTPIPPRQSGHDPIQRPDAAPLHQPPAADPDRAILSIDGSSAIQQDFSPPLADSHSDGDISLLGSSHSRSSRQSSSHRVKLKILASVRNMRLQEKMACLNRKEISSLPDSLKKEEILEFLLKIKTLAAAAQIEFSGIRSSMEMDSQLEECLLRGFHLVDQLYYEIATCNLLLMRLSADSPLLSELRNFTLEYSLGEMQGFFKLKDQLLSDFHWIAAMRQQPRSTSVPTSVAPTTMAANEDDVPASRIDPADSIVQPAQIPEQTTNFFNLIELQTDNIELLEFFGFEGSLKSFIGRSVVIWAILTLMHHLAIFVPFYSGKLLVLLLESTIESIQQILPPSAAGHLFDFLLENTFNYHFLLLDKEKAHEFFYQLDFGQVFLQWLHSPLPCILLGYLWVYLVDKMVLGRLGRSGLSRSLQSVRSTIRLLQKFATLVLILALELVVFPWCCGWILDFSSLEMFSASFESRMAFAVVNPVTSFLIHWGFGSIFMFSFAIFIGVLRSIVRPGLLHFIRNPNDPNYHPLQDIIDTKLLVQLKRILFSSLVYAAIIYSMFFLGTKLTKLVFPSCYPLFINFAESISEIPFDMILFNHLLIPVAARYLRFKPFMKAALAFWIKKTANFLGISSFILGYPRTTLAYFFEQPASDGGKFIFTPNFDQLYTRAELQQASMRLVSQNDFDSQGQTDSNSAISSRFTIVYRPSLFKLRVCFLNSRFLLSFCFFGASWSHSAIPSFLCPVLALLTLVLIGRSLIQFFIEKKLHELYSFCLGFLVLWLAWRVALFSAENFRRFLTGGLFNALKSFVWLLYSLVKLLYAAMLLGVVLPLTAGNYTSMLLLPFSVQPYQTPILFFLLNWASGVLNLRMFLLLIDLFPSFLKQAKEKLVRDGWWNIDLLSLNLQLVLPILATLLVLLLLPLHLSLFLFATLGYSILDCWNMQKWVPLASWLIPLSCLLALRAGSWIKGMAKGIRDEMYLIGRRLHNLER